MNEHTLYKTGDTDAPAQILDRNGEVVLALCRACGKAEIELDGPCEVTWTKIPQSTAFGRTFVRPAAVGKTMAPTPDEWHAWQLQIYAQMYGETFDEIYRLGRHAQIQRQVDHHWPRNPVVAAAVRHALEDWK